MTSWADTRREELKKALLSIRGRKQLKVVQPYFPMEQIIPNVEICYASDTDFRNNQNFTCDLFFSAGNRIDIPKLLYVQSTGRAKILATWFWDNHHQIAESMYMALISDVYFCGHAYRSAYLRNQFSLGGGFVPMLPIAWTSREVEEAAERALLAPRLDGLYGGYNSYPQFSHRDRFIRAVQERLPDHRIFLTPSGTPTKEHPYNSKPTSERIAEWMRHKVALCVSVDEDITMRMFDALLSGAIPLLAKRPADLDLVITREMQEILPIVVVDDWSIDSVAEAYKRCVERFDAGGPEGVHQRHLFVKNNHMPQHRMAQMIQTIRDYAERDDIDALIDQALV